MRTANRTNKLWIRLFFVWSLFLASAGATLTTGSPALAPETQESLGFRLRTAAIVVFRALRPLARRLGVELDLAAADEHAVGSRSFFQKLSDVAGRLARCEDRGGCCVAIAA